MVEPLTGESLFLEFAHLNTDCFQAYWQEFSPAYPHQLHIIPVDNATSHTTKRLIVPDNIILWFQPAHSLDGNPSERVWAWIKTPLAGHWFSDLEQFKAKVTSILKTLSHSFWSSITGKNRLLTELAFIQHNNLYTSLFN